MTPLKVDHFLENKLVLSKMLTFPTVLLAVLIIRCQARKYIFVYI